MMRCATRCGPWWTQPGRARVGSMRHPVRTRDALCRLIGDALDAAGIERCGATAQTVETSLLGRSLLDMLALRDSGFSRRAVMAWLAAAPVSIKRPDDSSDGTDSHRGRAFPARPGSAPPAPPGSSRGSIVGHNDSTGTRPTAPLRPTGSATMRTSSEGPTGSVSTLSEHWSCAPSWKDCTST